VDLWTKGAVFLVQKVNIIIHVSLSIYPTPFVKSELSLPSQQNLTTVPYNESDIYSSLSHTLFSQDLF